MPFPSVRKFMYEYMRTYEACPESKDSKVLKMYNIFNLQKRQYE